MKKIFSGLLLILSLAMLSCKPMEENYININLASGEAITSALKFDGKADTLSVVVDAGRKWFTKKAAEDDWVKIVPAAGLMGKTDAQLIVSDKIEDGARRATIEFLLIGSTLKSQIEIMQKGGFDFIELTDPDGKVLESPVEVNDLETTLPFIVNSGRRWTVKVVEGESWLHVKPDRGLSGKTETQLIVSENTVEEPRTAKLHFSLIGGKNITYDFEITQKAHEKEVEKPIETTDVLLDVEFAMDGSAKDVSTYAMTVEHLAGPSHMNYYNDLYQRNIAHFSAAPASALNSGYYKIPYDANKDFMKKLEDGHSIEVVFSTNTPLPTNKEVKVFTSHQSGGTGMETNNGHITFLPHVGGWKFVESKITPEPGRFYHAVGVWNKERGRAYLYVDGKKAAEMAAPGELTLSSIKWFGIGCDSGSKGEAAWNGDVAIARIYDSALSEPQVKSLYEKVKVDQKDIVLLQNVEYLPTCTIAAGNKYHIYAKGFKSGDVICFDPLVEGEENIEVKGAVNDQKIIVTIPSTLKSGSYNLTLKRGTSIFPIGVAEFTIGTASSEPVKTQVVAHRCFHKNYGQNTLAAFIDTEKLGVWGAEIDVNITKDKKVVVDHNGKYQKDDFANHTWAEIHADNPNLSLLDDFLDAMVDGRVPNLNMVLEIKGQPTIQNSNDLVDLCSQMILAKEAKYPGFKNRVVWISFYMDCIVRAIGNIPGTVTMFLGHPSPLAPADVLAKGVKGIDYSGAHMKDEWIKQAHELGMVTNVWTINSSSEMVDFIGRGVDYITTDNPDVLKELLKKEFVTE